MTAYHTAVDQFERLMNAPATDQQRSVAILAKTARIPLSSSKRHTQTLEREGFLRREEDGGFFRGPAAMRVGLTALGFGMLTLRAEPILVQLQQSIRTIAFLGAIQDRRLRIGPHLNGRDSRPIALRPVYDLDPRPTPEVGEPIDLHLDEREESGRRLTIHLACVAHSAQNFAVVGAFLPSNHTQAAHVREMLGIARDRFMSIQQDEQ